jgi:hypothetical protein
MSGRTIKRSDKVMTLSHPEKVRLIALLLEAFLQVMQGAHIDETLNGTSIVMGTRSGTLVVESLQNLTLIQAKGIEHPDRHTGLNGGFWIFPKLLRDLFFFDHSYRLLPICLYEATCPFLVAGAGASDSESRSSRKSADGPASRNKDEVGFGKSNSKYLANPDLKAERRRNRQNYEISGFTCLPTHQVYHAKRWRCL